MVVVGPTGGIFDATSETAGADIDALKKALIAEREVQQLVPVGVVVVPARELPGLATGFGNGVGGEPLARPEPVEDDMGHGGLALVRLAPGLAPNGAREGEQIGGVHFGTIVLTPSQMT